MSMADAEKPAGSAAAASESMDVDQKDDDYSEVMNDPAFLQSVLQNLPGKAPKQTNNMELCFKESHCLPQYAITSMVSKFVHLKHLQIQTIL